MNNFQITACLVGRDTLRYTLSGVAVCECKFKHCGISEEAGSQRKNHFSFSAVALGKTGEALEKEEMGSEMLLKGFIATASVRSSKLVLHITEYEKGV